MARPERLTRIALKRFSPLRGACGAQNAAAFCRTGVLIVTRDTAKQKGALNGPLFVLWRARRDSNSRPPGSQLAQQTASICNHKKTAGALVALHVLLCTTVLN